SPEDVKKLDAALLVQLLERLLSAEARTNSIPLSAISLPHQITIPDGGEDARISWRAGPDRLDFLPRRFCSFQCKASSVTPASLQHECWDRSVKDRRKLRPVFQSVLDERGAYIVFTRAALTPQRLQRLREALASGIRFAGSDPSAMVLDVYD